MPDYYEILVPQDPEKFNIKPIDRAKDIPENMRKLAAASYDTINVLKALRDKGGLSDRSNYFKEFFDRVIEAAHVGLVGEHAKPAIGADALNHIQADLVRRVGLGIRMRYLVRLTKWAAGGLLAASAVILLNCFIQGAEPGLGAGLGWVLVGAIVGAWLSVAVRRRDTGVLDLPLYLDPGVEPAVRLLAIGVIAVVVALGIRLEIIELAIEGQELARYTTVPLLGLLIGFVSGFLERAVSQRLADRVRAFVPGRG